MKKAQRYVKKKHVRVDFEQPQNICQYNQGRDEFTVFIKTLVHTWLFIETRNVGQFVVFAVACQSKVVARFIAIKKNLLGEKT